jgi:AmpD protein
MQTNTPKYIEASIQLESCWGKGVDRGWYRFASHTPSPNFSTRPEKTQISLVVIHSISLPPGEFGNSYIEDFFLNRLNHQAHPYFLGLQGIEVSSHFLIKRCGKLLQFVNCEERAWHAGASSFMGRENCNDYSIGIELEGAEFDGNFEVQQYETLSCLCSSLLQQYPLKHFVGHEHIAPGRKKDPGNGFLWQRFQKSLGLSQNFFPCTN